ncbi:hypothetical protein AALP_AA5G286900 [Arabis alpina]|uniref:FLZ-type domain-containing protein n=1 Tax=Arabis alpina TaxID=50452 RepID=A0A087H008_ARAAL|nr:hypothetical protein AALP_AA5G286900 [Arabis alpina]
MADLTITDLVVPSKRPRGPSFSDKHPDYSEETHAGSGSGSDSFQENEIDQAHVNDFLVKCRFCKKKLTHGEHIFMYGAFGAFCSQQCRSRQMASDIFVETSQKIAQAQAKKCSKAILVFYDISDLIIAHVMIRTYPPCLGLVTLYARMGLHRYNFLEETNYEFVAVKFYNQTRHAGAGSYYITFDAKDPAADEYPTFQTRLTNSERQANDDWITLYLKLEVAPTHGDPDHSTLRIVNVAMDARVYAKGDGRLNSINATIYISYKDLCEKRVGKDFDRIAVVKSSYNHKSGCFTLLGRNLSIKTLPKEPPLGQNLSTETLPKRRKLRMTTGRRLWYKALMDLSNDLGD